MPAYPLVDAAARHVWSKDGQEVFRSFCAKHAHEFVDAPKFEEQSEQNLVYYDLFQKYLKLYENQLSDFIDQMDGTDREFYEQLQDVQMDTDIKDKKLVKFVAYLVAATEYPAFYKLMYRAAKKINNSESKGGDDDDEVSDSKGSGRASSKGCDDDDDDRRSRK
jgi:hypothetical protein